MLKIDRHKLLEEELRTYGSILISTMSQKLDCSEETIRRDLKELEAQNKLKRIHGGAFLPEADDKGAPVQLRETFSPKKRKNLQHTQSIISFTTTTRFSLTAALPAWRLQKRLCSGI